MNANSDIEYMDFQSLSPLNVWMNTFSGNLLPMNSDNSSYSIFWKIYSVFTWSFVMAHTSALISGFVFIPKEKSLRDGMISLVIAVEVFIMIARIHTQRVLVQQLIRQLNDVLRVHDKMMRHVLVATLESMKTPLKFYSIAGTIGVLVWCCVPLPLIAQKSSFGYMDLQSPVAYSREPFSTKSFLIIIVVMLISNVYLFFKKVAVDYYMTHLILLITAQHRYTALKLVSIFRDNNLQNNYDVLGKDHYLKLGYSVVEKLKILCQHHISVINLTLMLKKLLSLNFSLIHMNGIFRFCSLAIMIFSMPSFVTGLAVITFACGQLVQLYIMCYCAQKLLDACTEITDEAFHEDWYQFGSCAKRIFILIIMASNVGFKLSTFDRFNLSLPSFMVILNQSYSIALLILKMT